MMAISQMNVNFLSSMMNHYGISDIYRKTSNISCTLVWNKIVDHSDVVGASPVGTALTTSSYLT